MIRFGPAGIPIGTPGEGTGAGIAYCRQIGLGAMEVEFVHGVKMGEPAARDAGAVARKNDVLLSCHAPYYINCCAKEELKLAGSVRHIVSTAQAAFWLGATPIVIHPGFYMGRPAAECRKMVISTLRRCLDEMERRKISGVQLGAELTGKKSAYGSLDEIIGLAEEFGAKQAVPVIDFAHYHAREARLKTQEDYARILDKVEKRLGSSASRSFHCHFSGIEIIEAGEKNHLPISSNSPPFEPLARAWVENGWSGKAICESPLLEKDALEMQKIYNKVEEKNRDSAP
ncbi:MAG: TIM barrel protein [Candidatus Micrarchaeota archaeon]|nr:TIM barrel protein [Candidatus Micrarchaeota archaeon]